MPADLRTTVQRMIDAGEPEENIATVIRSFPRGGGGTGASGGGGNPPAAGTQAASAGPSSPPRDWVDTAASWLPTVGGFAGGLLGGSAGAAGGGVGAVPGAALGAAAGGAGGKALEETINEWRHPEQQNLVSLKTLGDVAGEGALQGAYELGGGILAKGANTAGRIVYRKMLQPSLSARLMPRAAETVETGIREGLNPFSARSVGGLEPKIADINTQAEGIIHATGTNPVADPRAIAGRVRKTVNKFAGSGADPADRAAARSVPHQFLEDQVRTVPGGRMVQPAQTLEGRPYSLITERPPVKRYAPMSGDDLLQARRSTGHSAGQNSFGLVRGAETEARKELYHEQGTELGSIYPEAKGLFNQERQLIDLKDAAVSAHERQANRSMVSLRNLGFAGAGLSAASATKDPSNALTYGLLPWALTNPRVITRAALMAAHASPRVVSQFPRLLGGGIHAATASDRR